MQERRGSFLLKFSVFIMDLHLFGGETLAPVRSRYFRIRLKLRVSRAHYAPLWAHLSWDFQPTTF